MRTDVLIKNVKLTAILVVVILVVVLVLQNTQAVVTRLLFVTVSMPLVVLLTLALLIGFAGGILTVLKYRKAT